VTDPVSRPKLHLLIRDPNSWDQMKQIDNLVFDDVAETKDLEDRTRESLSGIERNSSHRCPSLSVASTRAAHSVVDWWVSFRFFSLLLFSFEKSVLDCKRDRRQPHSIEHVSDLSHFCLQRIEERTANRRNETAMKRSTVTDPLLVSRLGAVISKHWKTRHGNSGKQGERE
jgi:hypothetical protein